MYRMMIYSRRKLKMMRIAHLDGMAAILEFRKSLPVARREVDAIEMIEGEGRESMTSMELCWAMFDVRIPSTAHQPALLKLCAAEELEELEANVCIEVWSSTYRR